MAFAVWMVHGQSFYKPYAIWRAMERPDWTQIRAFARLGVPGGLAILVEVTSFTLMAVFIARLGTTASASHQIAANVAALCYMTPLSLAIATSSRVSFWIGAGDPRLARLAIRDKKPDEAGRYCLEAMRIGADRDAILKELGKVYELKNDFKKAAKCFAGEFP